ncbi:MAG: DUF6867 family protein [Geminicoccaceae bacterium]
METLLGTTWPVFLGLTLIVNGAAAVLTGIAVARNFRPVWQIYLACFCLALWDRFLVYALFEGQILHLLGFVIHGLALLGLALLAYRLAHVEKMLQQYPWRYDRVGLFNYREKSE